MLPELEPWPGKGEVLWRSLAATSGDLLVFIDSDLIDFDHGFVPALHGPLLLRPRRRGQRVQLVTGGGALRRRIRRGGRIAARRA